MTTGNTGNSEVSALLVQGFKAAKENRRDEAYNIFCEVVKRDPNNELGWLYRAATTDDLSESYVCLRRVLDINPNNEKAQRGIERIQTRVNADEPAKVGEDVVSGINPIPAPPPPPSSLGFEPAGFDFGQSVSSRPSPRELPDVPATVPPPYQGDAEMDGRFGGNDFGQVYQAPSFGQSAEPNFGGGYQQYDDFNTPPQAARQNEYAMPNFDEEPEYLNEPVQDTAQLRTKERLRSGRAKNSKFAQTTAGRRVGGGLAPVFGTLANARQRGRAAFGSESPTTLNNQGRNQVQRVQFVLYGLGALLLFAAIVVFIIILFRGGQGDPQAATATETASAIIAGNTTPGAASTVPIAGAETPTPLVTSQPVQTTAPVKTAAPVQTTPPQTTVAAPATTSAPNPNAATQPRAVVYTVKAGDSLFAIGRQFNTTVEALRAANPAVRNTNNIVRGQQLVVPVQRNDYRGREGVILKDGETLQAVAGRYNIDVNELARYNGFANPADAKPGDGILLP